MTFGIVRQITTSTLFLFTDFCTFLAHWSNGVSLLPFLLLYFCFLMLSFYNVINFFHTGMIVQKRLQEIEIRWPYFLGFGLPLSLITALPVLSPITVGNVSASRVVIRYQLCSVPMHAHTTISHSSSVVCIFPCCYWEFIEFAVPASFQSPFHC